MRHLLAPIINYRSVVRPCYRFLSLDRIKMSNEVELAKLAAEAQKVIFQKYFFKNIFSKIFFHKYFKINFDSRDAKVKRRLFLIKLSEKKFQLQSCMKMMPLWLSVISTLKHQLTFLLFQKQEFQCWKKLLMKTHNF